jgi:hypothetical protein
LLAIAVIAVLKLTLRLDLGLEYDSNANRSEVVAGQSDDDPPRQSALLRTTARVGVQWKRGINLLEAQAGLGAKVFFAPSVFDQDVVVAQASLNDRLTLGHWGQLQFLGDYYDAFQNLVASNCGDCLRRRDFRTGSGGLRLTVFDGPGAFWVGGAYRSFTYKPDAYFSFQTPIGDVGASVTHNFGSDDNPHDVTLAGSYHLERRAFSGTEQLRSNDPACAPSLPLADGCLELGANQRVDVYHEAGAELSYVGVLLASIGYAIQLNQSNSYGQAFLRHVVTLKLAYRLPFKIYATAKLQLYVSNGLDRVLLNPQISNLTFATIEDENRNAVIVDLERELTRGLAINARYSFYASTLGAQQTNYRRHVAYLGLTYRFSTR